jgi:hypothetical protein
MMNIKYISSAGYDFWSDECTTSGTAVCSGIDHGTIQLEYGWQLIAIPIEYGYWSSATHTHVHDEVTRAKFKNYVLDQITDLYGAGVVEVANTYTGDNQFFWSYVTGVTPESSPHNFQMIYDDGVHREISGFWIKIIGGAAPYIISWGEA